MVVNRKELDDISPSKEENERSNRPLLDNSGSPESINLVKPYNNDYEPNMDEEPVKDKYNLVYLVFLLFGIACLLPWNIFINATDYFVNHKLNTNTSLNSTYRIDFAFFTGNIGQTTNLIMNLINIMVSFGGNPKNRIPYTIMLCSSVIVFHIGLAIVDSSDWPFVFFIVTCISVFFMFVATGVMSSCVFYVSSIFPTEYINAIVLGNNLAGIYTSIASILSKQFTSKLKLAAIYYFLSAFIILMAAFIAYFVLHQTKFYKYRTKLAEQNKRKMAIQAQTGVKASVPYLKILRKTWLLLFCIWLNFFSTLAIFPVFQLGIQRHSPDFIISEGMFKDVIIFLTFNFLVTIGNMIPKVIRRPGPKWIPVPVILRAVLVFVFFAICNFKPDSRKHIPILITNDYIYWAGCILSPLLFGYFTSLLMMYTPRLVPEHSGTVSMLAGLAIAIGVATGLQFTKILEFIVLA